MQCPYCISRINEQALVCPKCARDLFLVKTLQDKINTLEAELRERQQAVTLLNLEKNNNQTIQVEAIPLEATPNTITTINTPKRLQLFFSWLLLWLLPLILLLIAHWLIVIVFDIDLLYLRIVSLLIPLPFAFMLMRQERTFFPWLFSAFIMAGLAVLGMSYDVYLIDQTPVLPQNKQDLREFIEYAVSIGFSYVTGMILGNLFKHRNTEHVNGLLKKIAMAISDGMESVEKIQGTVRTLENLTGFITAAATTTASIYNGFKIFQH